MNKPGLLLAERAAISNERLRGRWFTAFKTFKELERLEQFQETDSKS